MPTIVRNIGAVPSSPESIYISWDHPEYPNSQLTSYTIFYRETLGMRQARQSDRNISSDGFQNRTVGIALDYNLTGLGPFTNYVILLTVSGMNVNNAPFDTEVPQRTNTSGKENAWIKYSYIYKTIFFPKTVSPLLLL